MIHYRGVSWVTEVQFENFLMNDFMRLPEVSLQELIPVKPEKLNEWF